VVSDRTG